MFPLGVELLWHDMQFVIIIGSIVAAYVVDIVSQKVLPYKSCSLS